ncbi:putative bifunctional diguanylate cyclase/phosphodiesterase [Rheinheimera sp. MMS21-TC3]|uniref:putative bifunctional diguanylate cyclase/phosphodiesterase n=1 Tax=Rheinheimera sp. MMS21-TC3 TaxID=3072790 RepID=UPI0028C3C77D|nr:EAL domain-containing protein [Rheinheimera sp. MMS21-TC3]WNO60725.1 EAL domain-containing protein [Rheinheimera sp. MMS21-TC3]
MQLYISTTALTVAVLTSLLALYSVIKARRSQVKLMQSEEQLRLSLWGSGDELWDWRIDQAQLYRSSSWKVPVEESTNAADFPPNKQQIHPNDLSRVQTLLQQHLAGETEYFEATYRIKSSNNNWTWVLDRGKAVTFDAEGNATRVTGTLRNIQHLIQAEEQMQLLVRCLETISDAVMVCDHNFTILDVNPAFKKITGLSQKRVINKQFQLSLHSSDFMADIRTKLSQNDHWSGEIREQRPNGEIYYAKLTFDAVKDEQQQTSQFVAVLSDITERKRREVELNNLVNKDTLTGLPNRSVFIQQLSAIVTRDTEYAILAFDLDNFKKINDSLGHELGDNLLCKITARLSQIAPYKDALYRLGGDEFAILIQQPKSTASVESIAKDLLVLINQPFFVNKHELAISCSIGIVTYPKHGKDAQVLLRNADTAMYNAKSQGANRYLFFNDSMNQLAVKRLQIENLIRHGLKEDYFCVYYQPKLNITTGELAGMEALARFNTPKGGLISPANFIPIAEETGQIVEIGEVILRKACQDVKSWIDQGLFSGKVAVNLSSRQFSLPYLCEQIDQILAETGLASFHLELEITEGTVMQSPTLAIETMKKLRARGMHLAMDDFGTGYSSLAYLKQFPLNTLKIDKVFIDDLNTARGRNMVDTIVTIAHNLNLTVVAEGVEQAEQVEQLHKLRCEIIQGYYYSKPISGNEFKLLLQDIKQERLALAMSNSSSKS